MRETSSFQFKETIDLFIEFVYLATIFIIPLYFSVAFPTYNIFELSKLAIFKILVWLLLFLTVTKLIFIKTAFANLKKYIFSPLVFIVGLGLTLIPSINITQSFFGSYDRQAGYLSYLFYFLWFVLLLFNIRTIDNRIFRSGQKDKLESKIDRILIVVSGAGFLVALYGILQILGIDFLTWPENPLITRRTLSTFGQPNFLASWLLMVIPISAYFIYKSKRFLIKFLSALVLLAQLICLAFTSSRGGIIALGLTILLFIICLILFIKIKPLAKILASFGLLIVIVAGALSLNYIFPGRLSSLLDAQGGSLAARLNFYEAASDAITKKPVFGYGLENSGEVFIKYYQPDWGIYGDVGATTDKAHNLVLDIILATGFFGLAFFTIFYYYFFRLAQDNFKEKKMSVLSLTLALSGAAYLFSLLFSFSIVTGEIYFWLWLALLAVISLGVNNGETAELKIKSGVVSWQLAKTAIVLLVFIGVSFGIYYEFRVLMADYYFSKLYSALGDKQYFTSFVLADYAAQEKANPINQEYYSRFLGDKLSDFYFEMEEVSVKRTAQLKLIEIDKKLPIQGYENIYVKAKINSALGNYPLAEDYYRQILSKTPYWPKTYIDLGRALTREKRFTEALASYKLAESSLPDLNDSRFNDLHRSILKLYRKIIFQERGDIYFTEAKYKEAEEYYELAYSANVNDFTLLKKIADTYYSRGDLKTALEYNQRGANRNPSDYHWLLAIATLYKEMGNSAAAITYLDQAIKLAPNEELLIKLRSEY